MSRLPLIGVTICSRQIGLYAYHISGDKYVRTVASAAKGVPVIVPSLQDLPVPSVILDGLDDILFTGSLSNIELFHYSGPGNASGTAPDSVRATRLSLNHDIVEAGLCVRPLQWQSVPSDADASNNA